MHIHTKPSQASRLPITGKHYCMVLHHCATQDVVTPAFQLKEPRRPWLTTPFTEGLRVYQLLSRLSNVS